jgi:subtilase family serine protease
MLGTRGRSSALAAGAAGLLCLTTFSAIVGSTQAAAAPSRTILAGTEMPSVARQHPAGVVAKSSPVAFELVLQLRDPGAAQALVRAISSPGSASYRHYISAGQWESRFSPTTTTVKQATSWLRSEGFQVVAVSKDRITISASGTAGQVEKAFGTGLEKYRFEGQTVRLASSNLSVPASMASTVVGAIGINQDIATPAVAAGETAAAAGSTSSKTNPFPKAPAAFVTAPPCGSYYGAETTTAAPAFGHGYPTTVPDQVCGYEPDQLRSAYGLGSSDTGKGVTVAIIDAYGSATIASDATQYFNTYAPSIPFSKAHFSQDDALPFDEKSLCAASSWLVEQDIDVEAVHSMAPDASILYVGAQDCENGLFNAEQSVIDGGIANVVTNSWGDTGGDLLDDVSTRTAYDDLFMLADASGMTVQFSTGDDGDNFDLLGVSAADYPASSPYVTAVGGTTLQIGSNGQQTGQLGWATGRSFLCTAVAEGVFPGCSSKTVNTWGPVSLDGASGGFTSYNYTQPWYQAPVVPSSLALRNEFIVGPTPLRVTPDISMEADAATGILMGLHETFPNGAVKYALTRYGGTSLASPLLAGVIADADQSSIAAGGSFVGFINPDIYRLNTQSGAIDDILPGGKQAQYRTDKASTYIGPGAKGFVYSFREITFTGKVTYCDETGNCATRKMTQTVTPGYDSLTGLGSIGPNFVTDLANF